MDNFFYLILSVFLIVGVYQFYFWCQRNVLVTPRGLQLPIDGWIPYWPSWVWIYSLLYYPVILFIVLVLDTPRQFTHTGINFIMLLTLQMAFFMLFPVVTPESWRTRNTERNASERFLALVQRFDARSNSFPSMHCSVATLAAMYLYPHFGPVALAFPLLIGLSCLFTKQHFVIDVPAGMALGWTTFKLFELMVGR